MKNLNVRVYGILIQDQKVLISDEYIKGNFITKFPGGGLEYGEGTKDCLIREFKEELNLDIEIISHYFTTDFFVNSAFSKQSQLISIYYLVKPLGNLNFKISEKKFDFKENKEGEQSVRWLPLNNISENDFTFIIDKHVAEMLEK
ncbi:MAG: NUDIX domain-containing protein [Bacteroidota bacterium]